MDNLNSGVGPAEVFFSTLAAIIITVAVYTPWHLRQKRKKQACFLRFWRRCHGVYTATVMMIAAKVLKNTSAGPTPLFKLSIQLGR